MRLFYLTATVVMKILLITLTQWHVAGRGNVPRQGPLIIVSNHLSLVDPPLLGASIPRRITFMAKQELFNSTFSRFVVGSYGAFPVRRGQLDRTAMRVALGALHSGMVLGMFPEGKRSASHRLQSAQPGVSLIAERSGVPLLPVGISGTEQIKGIGVIFRRPRVTVNIGQPFLLPSNDEQSTRSRLTRYSEIIMEHIDELLPDDYKGLESGRSSLVSVNGN